MKFTINILICFFVLFSLSINFGQEKILVLHSYHQGLEWTDNITKGIKNVFESYSDKYELHFDYLDTKRNTSDEYYEQLKFLFETKSKKIKYSAVILSDNNALNFVKANRKELFNDLPIIFCGVNNFNDSLIAGMGNITGIEEKTDFDGNIELMLKLHPNTKKVHIINDKTTSGKAVKEALLNIIPKYQDRVEFVFYEDFLLEEVEQDLKKIGSDDLVYLLIFNRDRSGKFIAYQYGIIWIDQAVDVPIYGSWDFYLGKGIVGGNLTSGVWQGEEAARITIDVLSGKDINTIPVVKEIPNTYMFDYNQLSAYNINIEDLPQDSLIINQPPSFWQLYMNYIISTIIFLIIAVSAVISKNIRTRKKEEKLEAEKIELDKKVKLRTKSLEELNKKLKLEIDERIEAERKLIELKNELLDANKTKDKFFSIIAHDLKSPFNSILGLADILKNEFDSLSKKEILEMLNELNSASYKTYNLLEDLLMWASSQRGIIKSELVDINLKDTIETEIHVLHEIADSKKISVISNVDAGKVIIADRFLLSAVIRNLVSNAIKFTPNGGSVEINSVKENGNLLISISDTGIGIHDSVKDNIFKIDRSSSTRGTNNEVGTGLGLVLCKEFVDKMGGSIWFETSKNKGTTFYVKLPQIS